MTEMIDCICCEAAIDELYKLPCKIDEDGYRWVLSRDVAHMIDSIPDADVVARDCYDRILTESDTMREQLAQIGKKPGDKMDDVRPAVHGAWKPNPRNPYWLDCTVCGYGKPERMVYNFCPNCGADCREPNLDTTKGDNHD